MGEGVWQVHTFRANQGPGLAAGRGDGCEEIGSAGGGGRGGGGVGGVRVMGRPRLFAGVTAGALDSMLAHYTAFRKKRRDDAYSPGGQAGARPHRAAIAYTALVRHAFPGLPVVVGGI